LSLQSDTLSVANELGHDPNYVRLHRGPLIHRGGLYTDGVSLQGVVQYHECFSVPYFRGCWKRHQRLPLSSLAFTAVAGGAALALTLGGAIEKLLS